MVNQRVAVWAPRRLLKVWKAGLAVYLLAGITMAWAQQPGNAKPSAKPVNEATTPAASSDERKVPISDYTVSPEDLLEIQIMDVPEVSRTYRVSSNGFLTMPLLKEPIAASGVTLDQLSHLIATKFHDAGMLNNAQVTVALKETRFHAVLVSGEVKHPQSYTIYAPTRLMDLLVQAGGLAEDAGNDAIITRGEMGLRADVENSAQPDAVNLSAGGSSFTLDISKLMETGGGKSNVLLYPGDKVTVQRAKLVYLMGAVTRPGGYVLNESRQQITAIKALALAGDVTNLAKKDKIIIMRRDLSGPPEKRQEIPVNYKAIMKGQMADIRLVPDDILFVPESGMNKALHTTASAALQVATYAGSSLIIYH